MTTVIQTRGLVKQFRRVTALSDCDITVPEGRICALICPNGAGKTTLLRLLSVVAAVAGPGGRICELIGPNGAGKTTLLRLLSGLARQTAGEMSVLGGTPRQDPAFLAEIGFLAQEIPLYRRFTAEDHISIRAHLISRLDPLPG